MEGRLGQGFVERATGPQPLHLFSAIGRGATPTAWLDTSEGQARLAGAALVTQAKEN